MKLRRLPRPEVMVAGALEDGGRYLFIKRKYGDTETLELPHAMILQGINPVPALSELFGAQLGIDVQVHEVMHEGTHNAGSRKIKRWVPALLFKVTAKHAHAKPAAGLGYAWLSPDDAKGKKLARNAEWLFR